MGRTIRTLSLSCSLLPCLLLLPGCMWMAATAAALLVTMDEGGDSPGPPRIVNLKVVENPPGAGRATDLDAVEVSFDLISEAAESADVTVGYGVFSLEDAGPIRQATIVETTGAPGTPAIDPGEGQQRLVWDARADGLSGYIPRVRLWLTPRDANGVGRSATIDAAIGNSPPGVTSVDVVIPDGEIAISGNVIIRFELSDEADDPVSVELWYRGDEGEFPVPRDEIEGGIVDDLLVGSDRRHDVTWDSRATLGRRNLENVMIGIEPRDAAGARGDKRWSEPFCIHNSSPPEVSLFPPSELPDSDGAVALRLSLRDEEGDPADIVLQWSTDGLDFPMLSDLRGQQSRRRALLDPVSRDAYRIITPRLRTILEARCRVAEGQPPDEILLGITTPPTAITERLGDASLELLSHSGAVEQRARIVDVNSRLRLLRVDPPFSPPPRRGQRARVKETVAKVFCDLNSSSDPRGAEHTVAWDAPVDVGIGGGDGRYFFQATAFSGSQMRSAFATRVGKTVVTDRLGFVPEKTLALEDGLQPNSVIAADVDADGRLDVVAAGQVIAAGNDGDRKEGRLLIFRGADHESPACLTTPTPPRSIAAADFSGDGHLDLVAAVPVEEASAEFWVFVFLGRGDGRTFTPPRDPPPPNDGNPSCVAAADLNGDGRVDLVSAVVQALAPDLLLFFPGNGDGTLGHPSTVFQTGDSPAALLATDLNSDGHTDLVSADRISSWLSVFLADGETLQGTPKFQRTTYSTEGRPVAVAAADLDGDSLPDLISANRAPQQLAIFAGEEGGSFREAARIPLETGEVPTRIVAADLSGDGLADLVCAVFFDQNQITDQLLVFPGKGDGSFGGPRHLETGLFPNSLAVGDLNGDRRPDIVSADEGSGQLSVFQHPGVVSFRRLSPALGVDMGHIAAADLDGDGHLDLISTSSVEGRLKILLGEGGGKYRLPDLAPETGQVSRWVLAADLDGDGRLDLVSAERGLLPDQGDLWVFPGNGDGSFLVPSTLDTEGYQPTSVAAADLDRDGDLDLVCTAWPGRLLMFEGDGEGNFSAAEHLATGGNPQSLAAVDLNGDGHIDLACAACTQERTGRLSMFLADGEGNFGEADLLDTGVCHRSVAAADLDHDGRLDLVSDSCVDGRTGQILILFGDGEGNFRRSTTLETGVCQDSVTVADLDGDGRADLVSAEESGKLSIFLGEGDGTFRRGGSVDTDSGSWFVLAADLDEDGRFDLVPSGPFSIFVNAARGPQPDSRAGTAGSAFPSAGDDLGCGCAPTGGALDGDGSFPARERPYRINTSSGTIDGVPCDGFQGGAFRFSRITIEAGARVVASGENPLVLLATDDVVIDGELVCDGEPAADAGSIRGRNRGSGGGRGGPGGARGGDGGGILPGSGAVHGRRGGGFGGGGAGRLAGVKEPKEAPRWREQTFLSPEAGEPRLLSPAEGGRWIEMRHLRAASGAGGGHGAPGGNGFPGARGGSIYGNDRLDPLLGGSGGGGGSIRDDPFGPAGILNPGDPRGQGGDDGGGGGGGGGGALRIATTANIAVSGRISSDGGDAGRGNYLLGGHGGGGSGGSILLQAYGGITISPGAVVSALGGNGGSGGPNRPGGDGGDGRIRFEDADGVLENSGAVLPPSQEANVAELVPLQRGDVACAEG